MRSRYPDLAQQVREKCAHENMGWIAFELRYGISVRILGSLAIGRRVSPANRLRIREALRSYVPPWQVHQKYQHCPIAEIVARQHAAERRAAEAA